MILLFLACSEEAAPPVAAVAVAPAAPKPSIAPRVLARTNERMVASHVLIAYAGAMQALPNVTRSKEEAQTRAEEVRGKLLAGAKMADMARGYSDDSTGPRGGSLGGFGSGVMVASFEAAVAALEPGGLSPVVETPFGFHVIQRDALLEVHVKHLLVSYATAARAPTGVTRSKEDAKARIEEANAKLGAGAEWGSTVELYSDGPLKDDGGDLGWFTRGQLAQALDETAMELDVGARSGPVETPMGFHLLYRVQ